jgi:hypothetical protein
MDIVPALTKGRHTRRAPLDGQVDAVEFMKESTACT